MSTYFFKILLLCLYFNTLFCMQRDSDSSFGYNAPSPLVIVPGDGGSRAMSSVDLYFFKYNTLLWVNFLWMLLPEVLTKLFRLTYDPRTNTTKDPSCSNVSFPGWGTTETIENLDSRTHYDTTYFAPLVKELLKSKYYQRNKTLRGTPYDFRKAPNENKMFFENLKILIEDTYEMARCERVVLLGHSLGSLYSLYFLNKMSLSWKKKYIKSFVSVSGPLGGAVKAAKLITCGDAFESPRDPIHFRDMERSFPSTHFLLPNSEFFGTKPFIFTPTKNYSANDYYALFKDLDLPDGAMMYNDTRNLIDGSKTPEGISELYCIHGYGNDTVEQLIFHGSFDTKPDLISGDGDGTVNIISLEVCKKWKNVTYHKLKGAHHMKIVGNDIFIKMLKNILFKDKIPEFVSLDNILL